MSLRRLAAAALSLAALAVAGSTRATAQTSTAALPSPSQVLGFTVGADRTLADWDQIVRYLDTLANASPSVRLDTLGATTQGRPFVLAILSAPENMRRLSAIMAAQARLADPRQLPVGEEKDLMAHQPAVVLISCNIHSTEIASAQMAVELAYRLATNDTLQAALRNVVVLLAPSINPDGEQMVTEWYRAHLGTPWEGGPLPWLYHPYVGHDDNRDWYMVTQQETKLVTGVLYHQWFPEVVYDIHQMGNEGARLFVPPFVDPIDPNIDPLIVREIAHVGSEMALALQERGKSGVADHVIYDLWWHGGMRSAPTRHNMVGILTEAASARIATPITQNVDSLRGHERGLPHYERRMNFPDPWPGGTWRLRDIMDYEQIAAEALVRMLAEQREEYVRNFVALGRKEIALGDSTTPRAYVIPAQQRDPGAVAELERVLRVGGVQIEQLVAPTEIDGHRYDAGSLLLRLAQPYRAHVKDLFERQAFPVIERWPGGPPEAPYDVAGWTLPLQMGVAVESVNAAPPSTATRAAAAPTCTVAGERVSGGRVRLDGTDTRSYRVVARGRANGRRGAAFVLPESALQPTPRDSAAAEVLCARPVPASGTTARTLTRLPRIGLYRPWTANMDEGWTRWLLDRFAIPYVTVTDSMVRSGLRDQFDVLLVPSMSLREIRDGMSKRAVPPRYAGGLGASGIAEIERFVRAGGRLVLLDQASQLATALHLPVELITASRGGSADTSRTSLYAPGSVLRVLVNATHPLTLGMPDTAAVYFTNSVTFRLRDTTRADGMLTHVLARYPARGDDVLLSGYLQGSATIAGQAAAMEMPLGQGTVVMFGFRPQYRGQSWGTFRMLFNALLLNAPQNGS